MNVLIEALVFAVLIHINRRVDHGVVHGGVEVHHIILGSAFITILCSSFSQRACPSAFTLSKSQPGTSVCILFNAPSILTGRQGHFYFDLFAFGGFKVEPCFDLLAGYLGEVAGLVELGPETAVYFLWRIIGEAVQDERLVERHGEVQRAGACPAVGLAVTYEGAVV